MNIVAATTTSQLKAIETLAWEILPPFYASYIPDDHTLFFLNKFQTVEAIEKQIQEGAEYYLLTDAEKNAGYLGIKVNGNSMTLSKLYILDQYRGKGFGENAMSFVNDKALSLKLSSIELIVNRLNQDAIRFYEKRNFIITEPLVHTFENGHSVKDYKMVKTLTL